MTDILSGARVGPFIVFKDADGKRHAVRHGAIMSVSEDEDDVVSIAMTGNRTALVRQAFDRVLSWFR